MQRRICSWVWITTICLLLGGPHVRPEAASVAATDRIWLVPNPGSLDLISLFEHPEQWPHARARMNVFQFTEQHTLTPPPAIVGPNSYDALARAGAFSLLKQWGKHTAIGVGAVKEFYCTADSTGLDAAIRDAEGAIRAVNDAGGAVTYLAMDDPFAAGQARICGGPDLTPTADRLKVFVTTIRRDFPGIQIGQLEAYPTFAPDSFQQMFDLLNARGVMPAFLQLDIDIRGIRPPRDFTSDVREIREIARAAGVPMGVILWGYNGDADALFTDDLYVLANAVNRAFPTWSDLPEQLSIQSWAMSRTGLNITPSNLPETRLYTLTNTLDDLYRRFKGGPSNDVAIGRR